jgi:hypothetical protein
MISLNIPISQRFGSGGRLRSGAAVFVTAFFFFAGEVLSQEPAATPAASPRAENQPVFPVRVLTTGIVEMESLLRLGLYGDLAKEVAQKLNNNPETATKDLQLYLNGIAMPGIVPTILHVESEVPAGLPKPVYELQYCLTRDSDNEANRKAWEDFLTSLRFGEQKVQAGVGYVGQIPYLAPRDDLSFQVRSPWLIGSVIVVGLIVLAGLFFWFRFTAMLREAGADTVFSLGKSQMAFWGTVVALSFLGVCIISHRLERIPSQTLVLLGISGATGLSSVIIGQSKRAAAAEEKAKLEEKAKEVDKKSQSLQTEIAELKRVDTTNAETQGKVAGLNTELTSNNVQKTEVTQKIDAQRQNAKPSRGKDKWLVDILSDANGLSFYRFQVFIWTIILGGFFIWHVANKLSMPEFDTTLLLLMGISNGTYLGFKIPEDPGPK